MQILLHICIPDHKNIYFRFIYISMGGGRVIPLLKISQTLSQNSPGTRICSLKLKTDHKTIKSELIIYRGKIDKFPEIRYYYTTRFIIDS